MGGKRKKKNRANPSKMKVSLQFNELVKTYEKFDAALLWSTLFATASSPSARHRSASIGVALAASLRAFSSASAHQENPLPSVPTLIDTAAKSGNITCIHEDFVPPDPTNVATVRVGDELLRYIPGFVERPIADLYRALRFAEAVDDRLIRRNNFGIINVIRVALKYVDYCVNALLPEWQPAPGVKVEDTINLPPNELAAAEMLVSSDPLESLQLNQADLLALEWMTAPASSARYDPHSSTSPFGRTLRYMLPSADAQYRWLPPSYIPEILAHAVMELVDSLKYDKPAKKAIRVSSINTIRRALWRFSNELIESPPQPPENISPLTGNEIQWIIPVDGPNFIAVSVISTVDVSKQEWSTPACVNLAGHVRENFSSGTPTKIQFAGGNTLKLLPGAIILPLVVCVGTSHIASPQRSGEATLALEDLTWIAETASDNDDLYRFLQDLSSTDLPPNFGWEAINYWESWKSNGNIFFKCGITPDYIQFDPHSGVTEWERAVKLSRLEIALQGTGLPPLRDALKAEISSQNVASISFPLTEGEYNQRLGSYIAPQQIAWSLSLISPPIAIISSNPLWEGKQARLFLLDASVGLIFNFNAISDSWRSAHKNLGISGYLLWLQTFDQGHQEVQFSWKPFQSHDSIRSALWCFNLEKFAEKASISPSAPNALTAEVFEQLLLLGGVVKSDAQDLRQKWLTCQPFVLVEKKIARTKLNYLPMPWQISSSDMSETTASFARYLHAKVNRPGFCSYAVTTNLPANSASCASQ